MIEEYELISYRPFQEGVSINTLVKDETIRLVKKQCPSCSIALVTISSHLLNIFREGELDEKSTTEDFSVVQKKVQSRY